MILSSMADHYSAVRVLVPILLVLVAVVGATPPGIAKNPSHATCEIKKYKHCYNLVHVCPKFCPDGCTVECASCKPICSGPATPSTSENPPASAPTTPENPSPQSSTPPPSPSTPENPPPQSSSPTPSPSTPENPPPKFSTPPPSPSTPKSFPPQSSTPPPSPSTPENPPPQSSTPPVSHSSPKNSPPSSSTPSPPTLSTTPTPPSSGQTSQPKTARCKNKSFPKCYNMVHVCPTACPGGCEVDCVTCKPVCNCDRPGAVCQDPRFIGGDGITFYFHGKKDANFCLLSDPNLHINGHFIGRRNQNMKRDFTWVQSIAIFFDNHQLYVGAQKTAMWDDYADRLALTFDGKPITLPESEGATWKSNIVPTIVIVRDADANSAIVEVEGKFRITAKVVPITEEDSRIHKYGITKEDCFAHLDLGFKFFSLSSEVSGVLGQTYRPNYVSRVDFRAQMPVMGGNKEFETTSLFAPDCSVARFVDNSKSKNKAVMEELPTFSCASRLDGQGVVCKR